VKLVSVSVGQPREVEWDGEKLLTSIFKSPVTGRVRVAKLGLEGDKQSDLEVHGGIDKAVYAYPSEHYAYWREQLPGVELPWGAFGENLTTEGLLEGGVHIGDRVRIGSAEFAVTEPRTPCFKLAIRFGRPDIVKRFMKSGRSGFYLAVLKEGEVGAGDALSIVGADQHRISIAAVFAAKARKSMLAG
jgi:MOSC domain-containing protein YiiM